jgi:hypothetical protein
MVIRLFAEKRWPEIALTLALLSTCACVLTSSSYTRGTDQFWYVADVESLVRGQHVTNNIFPANLATPGPLPGPFVHNNITLYLVVPLATLLGGHWGWVATNLVCTIGSALLIFMSLKEVSVRVAALVASLFLLLPLTVWLTCTELSEPIYAFLATVCLFVWLRAKRPLSKGLFVLTAVAAALAKDNLAILLLVPVVDLCLGRGEGSRRIDSTMYAVGISALGFAIWTALLSTVFTENVRYSLAARLVSDSPPKNDNMAAYFMSSPPTFEWTIFWEKLARNIPAVARFAPAEIPFILSFYALLGLFLWCLVRNWKKLQVDCKERRASMVTILLTLSYFATVLFFRNQTRYTHFVIASLLISTSLFIRWTEQKIRVIGVCVACLVPVALVLAFHVRKEGMQRFVETRGIEQFVDSHLAEGIPLLVVHDPAGESRYIHVAFALRPRASLIIEQTDFCEQVQRYRTRFDVRYVFGPASFLATRSRQVANMERHAGRYSDYGIYDIQASCP